MSAQQPSPTAPVAGQCQFCGDIDYSVKRRDVGEGDTLLLCDSCFGIHYPRTTPLPGSFIATRVIGRVGDDGSCIIAEPGAKKTLCGNKSQLVGVCWAKFVQAHIDGHDPAWCETCLYLWSRP